MKQLLSLLLLTTALLLASCGKEKKKEADAHSSASKKKVEYKAGENLVASAKEWVAAHDEIGSSYDTASAVLNDSLKKVNYTLVKKEGDEWPYVELISIVGGNLQGKKGLKITYSCSTPLKIKLSQNDFNDKGNSTYSHYEYTAPASDTLTTVTTQFSEYKQPDWTPEVSKAIPLKLENVYALYFTPAVDAMVGGEAELAISELYLQQ